MTYKHIGYDAYIEYMEGLENKRENTDIDRKSEIVKILKPKHKAESKCLDDRLLIDVKFPSGYTFSIPGRDQVEDIKEFDNLFTLSIKVCDRNNKELGPDARVIIHKEKDVNEYETDVVRIDSTFYKNVSMTKFCKDLSYSTKITDELYKFDQGIEFKGEEHLRVYVVDTDIDIDPENVEFNINLDKWRRD